MFLNPIITQNGSKPFTRHCSVRITMMVWHWQRQITSKKIPIKIRTRALLFRPMSRADDSLGRACLEIHTDKIGKQSLIVLVCL